MPHIRPLLPENASPEVKDIYEDFGRRMGFPEPPNFIKTQGHSPSVAKGTWDLVRNVLVTGQIERWIKELIFAAIRKIVIVTIARRSTWHVAGCWE